MTDPVRRSDERHLHAVDTPAEGLDVTSDTGTQVPAETDASAATQPLEVIPACLRSRDAFGGLVRERAHHARQVTAWHVVRLPAYWWRTLPLAARTVGALVLGLIRWGIDYDGRLIRTGLADSPSVGPSEGVAFWRVSHQHWGAVRVRLGVLAATVGTLGCGLVWTWHHAPWWAWVLVGAVAPPILAIPARDPEKPLTDSTRYAGHIVPPLRAELIEEALSSLGHAQLAKGLRERGLALVDPIHRDGPGWRATIDLPGGVPAGEVIERRARLAAGLRRPLRSVWPQADPSAHEARLILWVGDQRDQERIPWPLAVRGRTDIFGPLPLGVTPQGRPVAVTLMYSSAIIGAVPRMGKTFCLRLLGLGAALDPHVELHVFDLKGGADLRPFGPVCHRYRSGDEPEDLAYLADDADGLVTEMRRRYRVLRELPESICPEGKITPHLAKQARLRFRPIVLMIDECHVGFEDGARGKQIEADITDLVKRGPAVGIIVILATQRPDAKSIPPGISGNATIRLALKVMKHEVNDMILGSGMYSSGYRATSFARSDLGTGYLVGEGDDPQIVRTCYVDGPTARTVVARARAARQAAGTLTGYAAGLDVDPEPAPTLLDDLASVMGPEDARVRLEDLVPRLVAYRPATYAGWDPSTLGTACRASGLPTVQVSRREDGRQTNRRGIDRSDLTRMITERDG